MRNSWWRGLRWLVLTMLMLFVIGLVAMPTIAQEEPKRLKIGSKAFPESWVLGEACAEVAAQSGARVEHKQNLGATEIVYQALVHGDIDLYPEYTGTIQNVFLKNIEHPTTADIGSFLAQSQICMSYPLGFSNTYALAVTEKHPDIQRISQLREHPDLRFTFNQEFSGRKDGWMGLSEHYDLHPKNIVEMQHELAYEAIKSNQVDVVNVYSTDAQIGRLKLKVLQDDKGYFPRYEAVLLYRSDFPSKHPKAWKALQSLVGRIDEQAMSRANAVLVVDHQEPKVAARELLRDIKIADGPTQTQQSKGWQWGRIAKQTKEHLMLVAASLSAAILVGVPLGIVAARSPRLGQLTLSLSGLLQTIPSLALLAFTIPILGTGAPPALLALFLYSLLPIIRNTYTGLTSVPGNLSEAAEALGLPPKQQLLLVHIPMASRSILAGIKTSAVINVGTATVAAMVGAGGLGQAILQGIALQDHQMILQGAIPSACLALLVQFLFDLLESRIVPRGLRL